MKTFRELPQEFSNPLVKCFNLLKGCNIDLFNDDNGFIDKYWRFIFVIPSVIGFYGAQCFYLRGLFRGEIQLVDLAFTVPVIVVSTQGILKGFIVNFNRNEIRSLIVDLGCMWRTSGLSEDQINKKYVLLKKLNFCYSVFYWLNIMGSWLYMLAPILETLFRKYILQQESELLLPFACRFPFDPIETWSRYIMVYIFEIYAMFRIIYYYLGAEFLMITLCAHLSTQFALLQEDLVNVRPLSRKKMTHGCDTNGNYLDDNISLNNVIKKHQRFILLAQQLDKIFNKMIFVNLSSATIIICFFGLSATVAHGTLDIVKNFIGTIASILPIFNVCYYGELLMQESAYIGHSAYENLWYKGSKSYQMKVWFIITRSQKPCCMTSMGYIPITLNTFTTVMSTTWSYFSLASTLYE